MENLKLIEYADADLSFYAIKYDTAEEEYTLEEGDEFIYDEPEELDDDEILEWAKQNGYFDIDDNGFEYVLEDGSIDFKSLRESKMEEDLRWQEEYPSTTASPSGRALHYFQNTGFTYSDDTKISIIDGIHPGNDWQGVIVKGYDSLISLQSFLFSKNIKVNFEIKSSE
jgi:hypothetical protein